MADDERLTGRRWFHEMFYAWSWSTIEKTWKEHSIGTSVMTIFTGIWGFFTSVSWPVWAIGSAMIFGFVMLGLDRYDARKDRKRSRELIGPITAPVAKLDLVGELKAAGVKFPPKLPLAAGYDRLIPACSSRIDLEEEIKQASHIWFAAIAGARLPHLKAESYKKLDRVLLINPESECMRTFAGIQRHRGENFPNDVNGAIAFCRDEDVKRDRSDKEIEVKLSNAPILNVVLFDPSTPHAWARVQEFIPYFLGQESLVYMIRKEDWKDLYETIESSFEQAWKNGEAPG